MQKLPNTCLKSLLKYLGRHTKNAAGGKNEKPFFPILFLCIENRTTRNIYLTRLTEVWRKKLGQKYFIGVVLMDLSKAFDCIPYFLVIAKLAAFTHT